MDLVTHRTILQLSASRAMDRIRREGATPVVDLNEHFWALHQGNWLTDMNQVTAFFDMVEKRNDPFSVLDTDRGIYKLPKTVCDNEARWTRLFESLWRRECEGSSMAALKVPASVNSKLNAQTIGGYVTYDHFDVVDAIDANGHIVSAESAEFAEVPKYRMTRTAHNGIFKYTRWFLLPTAFSMTRSDPDVLRTLGHAMHVLHDFKAHSNFVELMLSIAASRNLLDPELEAALASERYGSYAAYWIPDRKTPEATPVMTGRFDRMDTIWTILGILREGLVPAWSDLAAGNYNNTHGPTREQLFELMFGTFSDNPFTAGVLRTAMALSDVGDAVSRFGDVVVEGAISIFTAVAKLFTSPEVGSSIQEVSDLLKQGMGVNAASYAKAGRIDFLRAVIERKLRDELANAKGPILPHHTLIAKDKDPSHPEVRLAYKLACVLSVEVTTEIFYHFAKGDSIASVAELLSRVYVHPEEHLRANSIVGRLRSTTDALYGERWWLFAKDWKEGIIL